jgi:mono/diheme cytochrome c family protein
MELVNTAKKSMLLLLLCSGAVLAQSVNTDLGKREFQTNCASCHGVNGKGNGPLGELLRRSAPDLTTLTKRNAGTFPVSRMYEVIEGANVPSHGSRDMPVWGDDYRIRAAEYYADMVYNPDAYVRTHILALIDYISRLQER